MFFNIFEYTKKLNIKNGKKNQMKIQKKTYFIINRNNKLSYHYKIDNKTINNRKILCDSRIDFTKNMNLTYQNENNIIQFFFERRMI